MTLLLLLLLLLLLPFAAPSPHREGLLCPELPGVERTVVHHPLDARSDLLASTPAPTPVSSWTNGHYGDTASLPTSDLRVVLQGRLYPPEANVTVRIHTRFAFARLYLSDAATASPVASLATTDNVYSDAVAVPSAPSQPLRFRAEMEKQRTGLSFQIQWSLPSFGNASRFEDVPPDAFSRVAASPLECGEEAAAAGATEAGMLSTYFDETGFRGAATTRVDGSLAFYWNNVAPTDGLTASDAWSVVSTGFLAPNATGWHRLRPRVQGGTRLYLWLAGRAALWRATADNPVLDLFLEAGRVYELDVALDVDGSRARLDLWWSGPSAGAADDFVPVPADAYRHRPGAPAGAGCAGVDLERGVAVGGRCMCRPSASGAACENGVPRRDFCMDAGDECWREAGRSSSTAEPERDDGEGGDADASPLVRRPGAALSVLPGLAATWFGTKDFGSTAGTTVVPAVASPTGAYRPRPDLPDRDWSVVFAGVLRVEEETRRAMRCYSSRVANTCRAVVDQVATPANASLTPGTDHRVRVEAVADDDWHEFRLEWATPGADELWQVVPSRLLGHVSSCAARPCQNGGTCVGENTCRCADGYAGVACESLATNCSSFAGNSLVPGLRAVLFGAHGFRSFVSSGTVATLRQAIAPRPAGQSVTYSGFLAAPESGFYGIDLYTWPGEARLYLDGRLVVARAGAWHAQQAYLEAGQRLPLRLDVDGIDHRAAVAVLRWRRPNGFAEDIGAEFFSHYDKDCACATSGEFDGAVCGGHDRGACVNDVCVCDAAFTGDACSFDTCRQDECIGGDDPCFAPNRTSETASCFGRGTCETGGRCACDPGLDPLEQCAVPGCPGDGLCGTSGECDAATGACVCEPGAFGSDCEYHRGASSSVLPGVAASWHGDMAFGRLVYSTVEAVVATAVRGSGAHGTPRPGVPNNYWSARFDGLLRPLDQAGNVSVRAECRGQCRLYFDGAEVADGGAEVALDANKFYTLRLEVRKGTGYDDERLEWLPPGAAEWETVPERHLGRRAVCADAPCENGGVCVADRTCACPPAYAGPTCARPAADACGNGTGTADAGGLAARYFSVNDPYRLSPLVERVVGPLSDEPGHGAFFGNPELGDLSFATYEGYIRADATGWHTLRVTTGSKARVVLDGVMLGVMDVQKPEYRVYLVRDALHEITVRFRPNGYINIHLKWTPPNTNEALVPAANLYHRRGGRCACPSSPALDGGVPAPECGGDWGDCRAGGVCACAFGRHGEACGLRRCADWEGRCYGNGGACLARSGMGAEEACAGRGECGDGACACDAGTDPAKVCHAPSCAGDAECAGAGTCDDGACSCAAGDYGLHCQYGQTTGLLPGVVLEMYRNVGFRDRAATAYVPSPRQGRDGVNGENRAPALLNSGSYALVWQGLLRWPRAANVTLRCRVNSPTVKTCLVTVDGTDVAEDDLVALAAGTGRRVRVEMTDTDPQGDRYGLDLEYRPAASDDDADWTHVPESAFARTAACSPGCGSHGHCEADNKCRCEPGWAGARCDSPRASCAADGAGASAPLPGGLTAAFYPRVDNHGGVPVVPERVEPLVDLFPGHVSLPGVPYDFSVRLSGFLRSDATGWHNLTLLPDGGEGRVFLGGVGQVLGNHSETEITVQAHLVAGRAYPITVDFARTGSFSSVRLWWAPPGQDRELVPSSALLHFPGRGCEAACPGHPPCGGPARGACLPSGACECEDSYEGDACQYQRCQSPPACFGGGDACHNASLEQSSQHHECAPAGQPDACDGGSLCVLPPAAAPCPTALGGGPCAGAGSCASGACQCEDGRQGSACQYSTRALADDDVLPGLWAHFFLTSEIGAVPFSSATVPLVDDWLDRSVPTPGLVRRNFSVAFEGVLLVDEPGEYRLAVVARSALTLELNGELLLNETTGSASPREAAWRTLAAGPHPVRFAISQTENSYEARLRWQRNGTHAEAVAVPREALGHTVLGGCASNCSDVGECVGGGVCLCPDGTGGASCQLDCLAAPGGTAVREGGLAAQVYSDSYGENPVASPPASVVGQSQLVYGFGGPDGAENTTADRFSVRFGGTFTSPASGWHVFHMYAQSYGTLHVGHARLLYRTEGAWHEAYAWLRAGHPYAVEMLMGEYGGYSQIYLEVELPGVFDRQLLRGPRLRYLADGNGTAVLEAAHCPPAAATGGGGSCAENCTEAATVCVSSACDPTSGRCSYAFLDGQTCDDGNACTENDKCVAGFCVGTPKRCADSTACSPQQCSPDTGTCIGAANASAGVACATFDPCAPSGVCDGDGGCAPDDDDGAAAASGCGFAPLDNCTVASCSAAGGCTFTAVSDGLPCVVFGASGEPDPPSACFAPGVCATGACAAAPTDCDDGDPCTDDRCDASTGCVHTINTAPCDDGDPCTVSDTCAAGDCVGVQVCEDCKGAPDGRPCDLDDLCSISTCLNNSCVDPGLPRCSDLNQCTVDVCEPESGCTHTVNASAPCDLGACVVGAACDAGGSCVGGSPVACPAPPNQCHRAECRPDEGCVVLNRTAGDLCDDLDPCTVADTCDGRGACVGAPKACGDGNECTADSCGEGGACVHEPLSGTPCSSANACSIGDACAAGVCADGPALNCSAEDTQCRTATSCDPGGGGCVYEVHEGEPCDDGSLCTDGDTCTAGGECAGTPLLCSGNGACLPLTGECACAADPVRLFEGADCSTVRSRPVFEYGPDAVNATEGEALVVPAPELSAGGDEPPLEWFFAPPGAPEGVYLNETTGVVSWPSPAVRTDPYVWRVTASNAVGTSPARDLRVVVLPAYTATVNAAAVPAHAPANVPLDVGGSCTRPGADVAVWLRVDGATERVVVRSSETDGTWSVRIAPPLAGAAELGAHHPALRSPAGAAQASVVVTGVRAMPARGVVMVATGGEAAATFRVINAARAGLGAGGALAGLAASAHATGSGAAAVEAVTVQVPPPEELAAGAEANVTVSVLAGTWGGFERSLATVRVNVSSSSTGAFAVYELLVRVIPATVLIETHPRTTAVGAVRGGQTRTTVLVRNLGTSSATGVVVEPPADLPFLAVSAPFGGAVGTLPPGGEAAVELLATPGEESPLGLWSGSLAVSSAQTGRVFTPMRVTVASDRVGGLAVLVEDELSFWAEGTPKLEGATVEAREPFPPRAVVATAVSGLDGYARFDGLPEGQYEIRGSADRHVAASAVVEVPPGATAEAYLFLKTTTVSVTWTVTKTPIADEYTVVVEAEFVARVPLPVVTLEPSLVDPAAEYCRGAAAGVETSRIDFNVTNHGLIAAQNVLISLPAEHQGFGLVPLLPTEPIGDLPAITSWLVPYELVPPEGFSCDGGSAVVDDPGGDGDGGGGGGGGTGGGGGGGFGGGGSGCTTCSGNPPRAQYQLDCNGLQTYAIAVSMYSTTCLPVHCGAAPAGRTGGGGGGFITLRGVPTECRPCPGILGALMGCLLSFIPFDKILPEPLAEAYDLYGKAKDVAEAPSKSVRDQLLTIADTAVGASPLAATPIGVAYKLIRCGMGIEDAAAKCGLPTLYEYVPWLGPTEAKRRPLALPQAADALEMLLLADHAFGDGSRPPLHLPGERRLDRARLRTLRRHVRTAGLSGDPESAAAFLYAQLEIARHVVDYYTLMVGDPVWLDANDPVFNDALREALADGSEAGQLLSAAEFDTIMAANGTANTTFVAPAGAVRERFLHRVNNSVAYVEVLGVRTYASAAALGLDQNFAALESDDLYRGLNGIARDYAENVRPAYLAAMGEGAGFLDGVADAYAGVYAHFNAPRPAGICATVRIRIEQRVTLTRQGFTASLELGNSGGELTAVEVDLVIARESDAHPSSDVFVVAAPELDGFSGASAPPDANGTFSLGSAAAGAPSAASWLLRPLAAAAPDAPVFYAVGGTLRYTSDEGERVTVDLLPEVIEVQPEPLLQLDYFFQRDVYSDNPFTDDVVEPAEPFSLGLLVRNVGNGTAEAVRVATSQPKIVDNEKGLLVGFSIVAAQVGDGAVSAALGVDLGDVPGRGGAAVARWLMTSTLSGHFLSYNATLEQRDPATYDPRLSAVSSVAVHELLHVVAYGEDGRPAFLANDELDAFDLPDTIHTSGGERVPVEARQVADAEPLLASSDVGTLPGGAVRLTLNTSALAAAQRADRWQYVDLPDLSLLEALGVHDPESMFLQAVRRPGGEALVLGDNAWTTRRTVRLASGADDVTALLHFVEPALLDEYVVEYARGEPSPCAADPPPCAANVSCTNLPGAATATGDEFLCSACPDRFVGDGRVCLPLRGCLERPCSPLVECVPFVGPGDDRSARYCGPCPDGYDGNGTICLPGDPCEGVECFEGVGCAAGACGSCPDPLLGNGRVCLAAASAAPELLAPSEGAVVGGDDYLAVRFSLPAPALPGSVYVLFGGAAGGRLRVLAGREALANATHEVPVRPLRDLPASAGVAPGVPFSVGVEWRDADGNAPASALVTGVLLERADNSSAWSCNATVLNARAGSPPLLCVVEPRMLGAALTLAPDPAAFALGQVPGGAPLDVPLVPEARNGSLLGFTVAASVPTLTGDATLVSAADVLLPLPLSVVYDPPEGVRLACGPAVDVGFTGECAVVATALGVEVRSLLPPTVPVEAPAGAGATGPFNVPVGDDGVEVRLVAVAPDADVTVGALACSSPRAVSGRAVRCWADPAWLGERAWARRRALPADAPAATGGAAVTMPAVAGDAPANRFYFSVTVPGGGTEVSYGGRSAEIGARLAATCGAVPDERCSLSFRLRFDADLASLPDSWCADLAAELTAAVGHALRCDGVSAGSVVAAMTAPPPTAVEALATLEDELADPASALYSGAIGSGLSDEQDTSVVDAPDPDGGDGGGDASSSSSSSPVAAIAGAAAALVVLVAAVAFVLVARRRRRKSGETGGTSLRARPLQKSSSSDEGAAAARPASGGVRGSIFAARGDDTHVHDVEMSSVRMVEGGGAASSTGGGELPPGWTAYVSDSGAPYYYHEEKGAVWERPQH